MSARLQETEGLSAGCSQWTEHIMLVVLPRAM